MAVVIERVEALRKGLLAVGAEVALLAARHLAMFMNFAVTTEPTFHRSNSGVGYPLILSAHRSLTHDPFLLKHDWLIVLITIWNSMLQPRCKMQQNEDEA